MKRTIKGVTYTPHTEKQKNVFYPIVRFAGSKIGSQVFYLNDPKGTRGRALTIAKNYINNLSQS